MISGFNGVLKELMRFGKVCPVARNIETPEYRTISLP